MQMRGGGPANPYIGGGEPAAQQPGGQGGPAAPLPGDRPQGPVCNFFLLFLRLSPCRPVAGRPGPGRPAAGRPGYISVNFQIENIFL